MENSASAQPSLQIEEAAIVALKQAASWAKFIAIVGFVFVGLLVLCAIAAVMATNFINTFYGFSMGPLIGLYYLFIACIYFIPTRWLYLFSLKTQKAIQEKQMHELTHSFGHLKSYFAFFGILLLIVLLLIIISIIGVLIGVSLQG